MASVDDVKTAIEDAVPGRAARRRRLPVAVVMVMVGGVVALASRLGPVRGAVGSAASGVRTRVASMRGSGDTPASPAGTATGTETSAAAADASDLAAAEAASDATTDADTAAETPVGVGFDDGAVSPASPDSIPADTEEGRPAGV